MEDDIVIDPNQDFHIVLPFAAAAANVLLKISKSGAQIFLELFLYIVFSRLARFRPRLLAMGATS